MNWEKLLEGEPQRTSSDDNITFRDFIRLNNMLTTLREVQWDYQGQTIDNIIRQIESRIKCMIAHSNEIKISKEDMGEAME